MCIVSHTIRLIRDRLQPSTDIIILLNVDQNLRPHHRHAYSHWI